MKVLNKSIREQLFFFVFETPWLEMTMLDAKKQAHTSTLPMRLSMYGTNIKKSCQNTIRKNGLGTELGAHTNYQIICI